MLVLAIFSREYVIAMCVCVWFVSVYSHLVVAGVRAGTVSAPNPSTRGKRKFRDGDSVRVTQGRLRGHVGVVVSYADTNYTVRLQDGSDFSVKVTSLERTSLRCVWFSLSLCSHPVVADVPVGTVSAPNPPKRGGSKRKFRDGDSVRVTWGRLRGHVGVVVSFYIDLKKYTVRLQDGSECSFQPLYFERTSLRCVWFVSVCSHRVVAGVRAGTVSAPNPSTRSERKFRDGDSARVTRGRLRGHVGVVQSYADRKYTVRLQDGIECSLHTHYFERTSLRCVCDLSLCVFTPCGGSCACGDSVGPESNHTS